MPSHSKGFLRTAAERWERFTDSTWRCLIIACVFAFILVALNAFTWWHRDLNDDYAIANALSGRLVGAQGLCLFLNAALCQIIYALNLAMPHFNWYTMAEYATTFFSYVAIIYLALRRMPFRIGGIIIGLVALYALPGCLVINNFTFIAFISSCAGCMLLCASLVAERNCPSYIVFGIILFVLGSMWRLAMVLVAIPLFGLTALYIAICQGADRGTGVKSVLRLWPFALALVVGLGFCVYDMAIWGQQPWHDWRVYNDARAELSDYPHRPYSEVADQLDEIGMSENDYTLVFNWITEDPEFYTTEKIMQISDIATVNPLDGKSPFGVLKDYAKRLLDSHSQLIMAAFAMLIACICLRGRERIFGIVLVILAFFICVVFNAYGRLPERVHNPVWLYTIASLCMLGAFRLKDLRAEGISPFNRSSWSVWRAIQCAFFAVALVVPLAALGSAALNFHRLYTPERVEAAFNADTFTVDHTLVNYIRNHPDDVFVCQNKAHRELHYAYFMEGYYEPDIAPRIIGVGGWASRSPYTKAKNEAANMANPVQDLLYNDHAYWISGNKKVTNILYAYIKEHCDSHATCELVDTIEGDDMDTALEVYKFSVK